MIALIFTLAMAEPGLPKITSITNFNAIAVTNAGSMLVSGLPKLLRKQKVFCDDVSLHIQDEKTGKKYLICMHLPKEEHPNDLEDKIWVESIGGQEIYTRGLKNQRLLDQAIDKAAQDRSCRVQIGLTDSDGNLEHPQWTSAVQWLHSGDTNFQAVKTSWPLTVSIRRVEWK